MTLQDAVFLGAAALVLGGGFMAVWLRNIFYNALALILCLFGVAALFIFLGSEFLAVMEVIIYIGAIAVAIIFAIMLSQPGFRQHESAENIFCFRTDSSGANRAGEPRRAFKTLRSLALAVLLFAGVWRILRATRWPSPEIGSDDSLHAIGKFLLTDAGLAFEIVSVVLLVAIIGALLISEKTEPRS